MEQSIESNFFQKFKILNFISLKHRHFIFRKSSNPGHKSLVLITSTVQVELAKLSFNLDDVRTYFLQVLRDCQQKTSVTLNGFLRLSKKDLLPPVPNGQCQDG